MLIEVIVCALALFFMIGALIAIPLVRVGKRLRDVLAVKSIWYAMVMAIPLVLHLPLAIVYYHGAQLIGHPPRPLIDNPFGGITHDTLYLFLSPIVDFSTHLLFYPLEYLWLLPVALCGFLSLVVYAGQRFRHLSKRDFVIVLLCLIAGWAFAVMNDSTAWWMD